MSNHLSLTNKQTNNHKDNPVSESWKPKPQAHIPLIQSKNIQLNFCKLSPMSAGAKITHNVALKNQNQQKFQALPIFNCRLDFKHPLTKSPISSPVNGSPSISSLDATYRGPAPARYGPGAWTGLTPFLFGGGSRKESNSLSGFLLGGSGARPVHGLGIVEGPNGTKGRSRSFTGFAFGVSV